ncbi:MAG: endonuclease/exonuclease/phosphatase family protein [Victivallaceae bacterium]
MKKIRPALLSTLLLLAALTAGTAEPAQAPKPLKVIAYNVLIGFNHGTRLKETAEWLTRQDPDVILFQEIARQDSGSFAEMAKLWGHHYAAVAKPGTDYSIALTSKRPFQMIETRTDGFHHGYVLAKIDGIYYMSIHLSPFKYKVRIGETALYLERLKPLLDAGEKVIVMGDFNNPSPYDKAKYDQDEAMLAASRKTDAKFEHIENLNNGNFDYRATQQMLDGGLEEVCYFYMKNHGITPRVGRRIDLAFVSRNLVPAVEKAYIDTSDYDLFKSLSDHFPVILTLERKELAK